MSHRKTLHHPHRHHERHIDKRLINGGVILLALIVCGVILYALQVSRSAAPTPASADSSPNTLAAPVSAPVVTTNGAPRLMVAQDSLDHGTQHFGQQVSSIFTVENTGTQPLTFAGVPRVEVVEGCCPPSAQVASNTLAPGEKTTITLRYTMHEGMGGKHLFRVHVRTNDPTTPDTLLYAASNWVP